MAFYVSSSATTTLSAVDAFVTRPPHSSSSATECKQTTRHTHNNRNARDRNTDKLMSTKKIKISSVYNCVCAHPPLPSAHKSATREFASGSIDARQKATVAASLLSVKLLQSAQRTQQQTKKHCTRKKSSAPEKHAQTTLITWCAFAFAFAKRDFCDFCAYVCAIRKAERKSIPNGDGICPY